MEPEPKRIPILIRCSPWFGEAASSPEWRLQPWLWQEPPGPVILRPSYPFPFCPRSSQTRWRPATGGRPSSASSSRVLPLRSILSQGSFPHWIQLPRPQTESGSPLQLFVTPSYSLSLTWAVELRCSVRSDRSNRPFSTVVGRINFHSCLCRFTSQPSELLAVWLWASSLPSLCCASSPMEWGC